MKGLHILQIDGVIIEVIQVDDKGGTKMLLRCPEYTQLISDWHWEIIKEINQCLS